MNEILTRRNPVLESLRSQRRQIIRLWLQNGLDKKLTAPILQAARAANVTISHSDKQKLTKLAKDGRHQGVVLECGPYPYAEVDEMLGLDAM
ncbi:MAG: RNA methyltransferase substrate-binding domain-containing protein, partial [Anaerolineae bacterium]